MQPGALAAALLLLTSCAAPPPPPAEPPKPDPTLDASYRQTIEELATLTRNAEDLFRRGNADAASADILKGQPMQARLLAAPQPTLAALEAASDLDDLYARMLLSNHRDGWARLFFQKNLARWKIWTPQTPDTARRLKAAQDGIAECDRRLAK